MKNLMRLILLILCLPSWAAQTDSPLYQVEIIIFQNPNAESSTEKWPEHPLLPDLSKAIQLSNYNPQQAIQQFELLPTKKLLLNKEQWVLTHKLNATILLHYAWLQDFSTKKTLHLYANPLLNNASIYTQAPYASNENWAIDGLLSLNKTNYFNLSADLMINSSENGKPSHFIFKQKRKLRAEETHYIDHPLIGMIVKIKTIKTSSNT